MRIAIDHSPLVSSHKLAHKIRGTGYYIKNLIKALQDYHPENEYILFTQGEKLPSVDIVHYPYFEPFSVSLPIKKAGKTIVTVHDLTPFVLPNLFPAGIRGNLKFQVQKMLVKRSDAIITDSDSSKQDIKKILKVPSSKVFSILLAADPQYKKIALSKEQKEKIMKKYNIPDTFALYVGDATPNKNIKRLVEASILGDFSLVMVGGALAKQDIDRSNAWNKDLVFVQEKIHTAKNIHVLGFVEDADLALLYNMATVFVFPSLYEGFGLPVLEAAASGCPVVTSNSGSIPEVIGKAAEFVDPYSIESIADGVRKVLDSKDLQTKLSKQGKTRSEEFTWKKTSDKTTAVYEEVFQKT